jgi:lysophospholipase L1-like esterase
MVNARIASGQNLTLVDLNSSITAAETVDGTHPTQGGYSKIADVWYQTLNQYYTP